MSKILNLFLIFSKKNISMVSQDIILFDDTVRANVAYANMNASDEQIKKLVILLLQVNLLKNCQIH